MGSYQREWTLVPSIQVQGNTSTPSVIRLRPQESGRFQSGKQFALRVQVTNARTYVLATNATIAPTSGWGDTLLTHTSGKDLTVVTDRGVNATGVLTVSGVVIDGETVTIGSRVYEFDTNGSVGVNRVAANIASGATAAQGTLTIGENVTVGDTMTIGTRTYAFVALGTADQPGEIEVAATEAATKTNIVAAVNGTDGFNTPNSAASAGAFAGDDSVITARTPGTAGNSIVTTETFTDNANVFDAATLGTTTAGVDCIAATAITALVAAVNGDAAKDATAADGAGDTVDVTALSAGVGGNTVATTETMANGSFLATKLAGGEDPVAGEIRLSVTNATAETVTLRFGPGAILALPMDYNVSQSVTHAAP